jgi:hypothetical protein
MITEKDYVVAAIERLCNLKQQSVMFYNTAKTIRYILSIDDEDEDAGTFTVGFYYDLNDPTVAAIIQDSTPFGCEPDEDGEYEPVMINDYELKKAKDVPSNQGVYAEIMEEINAYLKHTVCPCNKQFIEDGREICIVCEMFATREQMEDIECVLCAEKRKAMFFHALPCCGEQVHTACLEKCRSKCPFCRAAIK